MTKKDDKKINVNKTGVNFYLNNKLYRLVRKSRASNICYLYNYETDQVEKFTYKDYKKFKKRAFTISEVARMLDRHPDRLRAAIYEGGIKKPYLMEYEGRTGVYYFSEEDIYRFRDYFATLHRGRPRSDGLITSSRVPSVQEIDAILGKREMLYVRLDDGTYVPVWRHEDFE